MGTQQLGAIDAPTVELYLRYGPTSRPPAPGLFASGPTEAEWRAQLAGQTRLTVTPNEALYVVRAAWRAALKSTEDQEDGRDLSL